MNAGHAPVGRRVPGTVLALITCATWAAVSGPDANWDLRNYHLYVAWAWLEDRHHIDLAAAQAQTWFNPLLWVPHFIAFQYLGGTALAVCIGALQGLCAFPLALLAERLLPALAHWQRLLLVAAGMGAATFVGQLGASYGDILLAGLALGGALLAHSAVAAGRVDGVRAFCGGVMLGAVAALKLSHAPVALGLCVALPLLAPRPAAALRLGAFAATGALAAFAALAGPWAWTLWQAWGNPVFPQFETVFGGTWLDPQGARDLRFVPASVADALQRPLAPLIDWRATSDYRMRDARIILLLGAISVLAWRWREIEPAPRRLLAFIGSGFLVAYLLWLPLFGYHRYLVAFELVAPLVLFAASAPGTARRLAGASIALTVLATNPPNHERAARDWPAGDWLRAEVPWMAADTLVIIAGPQPVAHVLVGLPPFAAAVRIDGNLHGRPGPRRGLDRLVATRIAAHRGPLLLLVQTSEEEASAPALDGLRLRVDSASCMSLVDMLLPQGEPPVRVCRLERTPGPSGAEHHGPEHGDPVAMPVRSS